MVDFVNGDILYKDYIKCVNNVLENDELFNNFKSDENYRFVLEHVSKNLGDEYLKEILKDDKMNDRLWEKMLENDKIGNPIKYKYKLPIGERDVSPTTLRYIKYSLDVIKYVKKVENFTVVELGGGYGGFCKIFHDLCDEYDLNINYMIYDLEAVSKLSKKYLNNFELTKNVKTGTLSSLDVPEKIDLFLSFYAYSELSDEFMYVYNDILINISESGYMCWNSDKKCNIEWKYKEEKEKPLTGVNNKIIYWQN